MKRIIYILIVVLVFLILIVNVSISEISFYDYTKGKADLVITQKSVFDQIKGYTRPNQKLQIIINGKQQGILTSDSNGVYLFKDVNLKLGLNQIVIRNLTKNRIDHEVEVYVDLEDPLLNAIVFTKSVYKDDYLALKVNASERLASLTGEVTETKEKFIFIPDEKDPSKWIGKWKVADNLASGKRYRVEIVATDLAGNVGKMMSDDFEVSPRYALLEPKDNTITSQSKIWVKGRADKGAKVIVNDIPVLVDEKNTFQVEIPLKLGKNLIVVSTDAPGLKKEEAMQELKILRQKTFIDLMTIKRKEYQDIVTNLATLGIIPENPDEVFKPDDPATRGELSTWLIRALDLDLPDLKKKNVASDVPSLYWRAPYIKLAVQEGFFQVYDDGSFKPNFGVTEEEGDKLFALLDKLSGAGKEKKTWIEERIKEILISWENTFDQFSLVAFAQEGSKKKYMSKIEAAKKLSKTETVKKKQKNLMDWSKGFTAKEIFKTGSAPGIKFVRAVPQTVNADGKTVLLLQAGIYDPKGNANIKAVRGDLTSIGNISNFTLVDNGKWGDKTPNDGIYSLQTTVSKGIKPGTKTITITAANREGWAAASKAALAVAEIKNK